jgi:hypothetical protein
MGNPVREKKWYREWLAWRLPALRVIDFQRIRDKVRIIQASRRIIDQLTRSRVQERQAAKSLFLTAEGLPTALATTISTTVSTHVQSCRCTTDEPRPAASFCQSRTADVKRRCGQSQTSHRKGDISRGDQEIGEESKGRVHAEHGRSGCMITVCCNLVAANCWHNMCCNQRSSVLDINIVDIQCGSIASQPNISNPKTVETESDDCTHVGERRDAVKASELDIQCLHLCGYLCNK